jgi:hypothetical protein
VLLDGSVLSSECGVDTPESELPSAVLAECMYGDFHAAALHLKHKLILIPNPEEVRGGGLLKVRL